MQYSLLAFSKRSRCRRRHRGRDGLHCVREHEPEGLEGLDSALVLYYLKEGRGDRSEGLEGEGMDPGSHSGGTENNKALQYAGSGSQSTAVQGRL